MVDISIALEALGALCSGNVTSVQVQESPFNLSSRKLHVGPQQNLSIKLLIPTVLAGDEKCKVSRTSFHRLQSVLSDSGEADAPAMDEIDGFIMKDLLLDEEEFFDPKYHYDFTKRTDKKTYYRGEEKYERPCGWQRFALKVLDKYHGNTWLGNRSRRTQSCPGEWPVSYHGTSMKGANCIIGDHYEPGPRKVFGTGIYSTPDISEASLYAKKFKGNDGKMYKAVLQNRVNPLYRKKYKNGLYWLVPIPHGTSAAEEQNMVERAIRPYGLLVKEV